MQLNYSDQPNKGAVFKGQPIQLCHNSPATHTLDVDEMWRDEVSFYRSLQKLSTSIYLDDGASSRLLLLYTPDLKDLTAQ